jgi:hypothetical protein
MLLKGLLARVGVVVGRAGGLRAGVIAVSLEQQEEIS